MTALMEKCFWRLRQRRHLPARNKGPFLTQQTQGPAAGGRVQVTRGPQTHTTGHARGQCVWQRVTPLRRWEQRQERALLASGGREGEEGKGRAIWGNMKAVPPGVKAATRCTPAHRPNLPSGFPLPRMGTPPNTTQPVQGQVACVRVPPAANGGKASKHSGHLRVPQVTPHNSPFGKNKDNALNA